MVSCEFPISAPGIVHLATLLVGIVCCTLGFMTHFHSSWVAKEDYRLCLTAGNVWNSTTNVECPDISLETAFLIIVVICTTSSMLWYCCEACCLGNSKTATLLYVIYLVLTAVALFIGGLLYMKSATLIAQLPGPDFWPVLSNMGKVIYAAYYSETADDMILSAQSDEQTYYQEKMAAGCLTIINGVLHIICAWLAVIDLK